MIPLDSPDWSGLRHAYGPAADTPRKLAELREACRDPKAYHEAWNRADFWSSLCHQGSVYSATFAAIPHLVGIARRLSSGDRVELVVFIGCCASSAGLPGTTIPEVLKAPFWEAIKAAIP